MNEYIKRKYLVDLVLSKLKYLGDARIMNEGDEKVLSEIDGYEKALEDVHKLILDKDLIENIQPVKHGKWINHRINDEKSLLHGAIKDTTCSECGKSTPYKTDYCMHCGARMDGDTECQ